MTHRSCVKFLEDHITDNWAATLNAGSLKREVCSRVAHLALMPGSFFAALLDTGIGSILSLGGGAFPRLNYYAYVHLSSYKSILTKPYEHLVWAVFKPADEWWFEDDELFKISLTNLFLKNISSLFKGLLRECENSNFMMKHVVSRVTVGLVGLTATIACLADGLFCLPLAAFSLITFRKCHIINRLAIGTLQDAPQLFQGLTVLAMALYNPSILI